MSASALAPPPANRRLLLISDESTHANKLVTVLETMGTVSIVSTSDIPAKPAYDLSGVIVELNLRRPGSVQSVRDRLLHQSYQSLPRLFVLNDSLHHSAMQAWALGATDTIAQPFDARDLQHRIRAAFSDGPAEPANAARLALAKGIDAANLVMTKIFQRLPMGARLSFNDVMQAETQILKAIKRTSLQEWLTMVGRHHESSYRHSLYVTGFAVAFAQNLGMREDDQRRLTRAALLHDVGKAFIPIEILDKPGELTPDERKVMQTHSQIGHDTLAKQGGFPPELLDVVLHHHEKLDGTGYPHGLHGDQISDILRVVTIADIFTALIEHRTYRAPMPPLKAFALMESMTGKIDPQLLQAFRPVALGI